jgi:hypothetical protein
LKWWICLRQPFEQFESGSNQIALTLKFGIFAQWRAACIASSVHLLLGRLSGADVIVAQLTT